MDCPCCNRPVDLTKNRGLAINRAAYLRAQLVVLEGQYDRAVLFFDKKGASDNEHRARTYRMFLLINSYKKELEQLKEFL